MAKCVYCGKATIVQIDGRPVCTDCSDLLDAGKKPPGKKAPDGRRDAKK